MIERVYLIVMQCTYHKPILGAYLDLSAALEQLYKLRESEQDESWKYEIKEVKVNG